jgi:hypothetical protein
MAPRPLEITDLLWPVDSGGALVPVVKADVLDQLRASGQRRATRIVLAIPAADGILDRDFVDALGFRVHCELQRLGEELQLARRVAALLSPIVARVASRALARCASSTWDAAWATSCGPWRPRRPWALMSS